MYAEQRDNCESTAEIIGEQQQQCMYSNNIYLPKFGAFFINKLFLINIYAV